MTSKWSGFQKEGAHVLDADAPREDHAADALLHSGHIDACHGAARALSTAQGARDSAQGAFGDKCALAVSVGRLGSAECV